MEEAEFNELVAQLHHLCPEPHKEWLSERLKYGNEINLRQRIKLLVDPFWDAFENKDDRKRIITRIVDTRNDLTHYDSSLKERAASGRALFDLCDRVEVIFQAHLLQAIGFNKEDADTLLEHSGKLKQKLTTPR